MTIVRDENTQIPALAIVEKYETFVDYLYPILQNCPRKHGVARDAVLAAMFVVPAGIYGAAKSKQVSRLFAVDADLATLRYWLRFLAHANRRIISKEQHRVALALLSEVGAMLGGWIKSARAGG